MAITVGTTFKILVRDGLLKPGRVLDLGCGTGVDAEYLAKQGYTVDAVDSDSENILKIPANPNLSPILSKIEDYIIKENYYNLVSAQYVLHFLPKETAHNILQRMVAGTISGGVISFNVLGGKDDWKTLWTTWDKEEIEKYISQLPVTIYKRVEEEGHGMTKAGSLKLWHVMNYVLIKK
ncbi:MAG: class I SAM-dependent methyltransferase [Candidatus Pacebacteria bacterium]|nr:class I SAM-dependent methyltransferase [Candidatus Paceibacterota bacterium]